MDPEVESFAFPMNAQRVGVDCAPLAWNGAVAQVAVDHSLDMVERGFFSHTNPDGDSPFDRLSASGIEYARAAENIAGDTLARKPSSRVGSTAPGTAPTSRTAA